MSASVIRLRQNWNGRAAGMIVGTLGSGVMQELVDRKIAEWVGSVTDEQPKRRGRPRGSRNLQDDSSTAD